MYRLMQLVPLDRCLTAAACLSSACLFAVSQASDLALLVGYVGSCRFDRLSFFINFVFFSSVFFLVEPENDIRFFFLWNYNNKFFYSTLKSIFTLFSTEETKSLIIPIYYT